MTKTRNPAGANGTNPCARRRIHAREMILGYLDAGHDATTRWPRERRVAKA